MIRFASAMVMLTTIGIAASLTIGPIIWLFFIDWAAAANGFRVQPQSFSMDLRLAGAFLPRCAASHRHARTFAKHELAPGRKRAPHAVPPLRWYDVDEGISRSAHERAGRAAAAPRSAGHAHRFRHRDFGFLVVWQGTTLFLMYFYTDVIGIEPVLAGTIYLVAMVWDAVTDPVIAALPNAPAPAGVPPYRPGGRPFGVLSRWGFHSRHFPVAASDRPLGRTCCSERAVVRFSSLGVRTDAASGMVPYGRHVQRRLGYVVSLADNVEGGSVPIRSARRSLVLFSSRARCATGAA